MCIICVSAAGVRQPNQSELKAMFNANRDGAGYMVARGGKVEIHKGFMEWGDFLRAIKSEHFGRDDSVVYHFRISTQAGVCPGMTHPFPLSANYSALSALDVVSKVGVAHNGIIRMTSNGDKNYSDTALFIGEYLTRLIRKPADVHDPIIKTMIDKLIDSKMALLTGDGRVSTVGSFISDGGLLFSNSSYKSTRYDVNKWFKVSGKGGNLRLTV